MKNYVYHTNDVHNALIKAGYKPTSEKSRKDKKTT